MVKGSTVGWWLTAAAAAIIGTVGIDNYRDNAREKAAYEAQVVEKNRLFSDARFEFKYGDLDMADAKYDSAQAVFPDITQEVALGEDIDRKLMTRKAKQDSLDFLAFLEARKLEREAEMRADFGPVNPRTGLMEYSIKPGENLWNAASYFLATQNLDRTEERRTFDVWSPTYDMLVAEEIDPDSVETGMPVYFKATEEQRIEAQLIQENQVLTEVNEFLGGSEDIVGKDFIQLYEIVSNQGNEELATKIIDVAELSMAREEKAEFEKCFKAHAAGNLEEAVIGLDNAVNLHRRREVTGFLAEDISFYETYSALRDQIVAENSDSSWSEVKVLQ